MGLRLELVFGRVQLDAHVSPIGLVEHGQLVEWQQHGMRADAEKAAHVDHSVGDLPAGADFERTYRSDRLVIATIDGRAIDVGGRQVLQFRMVIAVANEPVRVAYLLDVSWQSP